MTKRAVILVFVGILTLVSGCGTQSRQNARSDAPSTVQAASPQPAPAPDQNAAATTSPSQEQVAAEPHASASQPSAPDPDLNYVTVDLVASGTVWNDRSQSRIRVIETTNSEGDIAYFTCDTALRGKENEILRYNGKPLPNHTCFQPKLHVIYTLKSLGDGSEWYWMNPPGDDGDVEMDGKHPLVLYCPQCKPDYDNQ